MKFAIAVLTFCIGISVVSLKRDYPSLLVCENDKPVLSTVSQPVTNTSNKNLSNKIEVRFVRFTQNGNQTEAEIELTNNTNEIAYYYSYGKEFYPFPKLKRNGKIVTDHRGRCGTGILEQKEQMLLPRETVLYQVPKSEIVYEPTKSYWKETDKATQIGFPFAIGEKRKKEVLWSEEIKFSK